MTTNELRLAPVRTGTTIAIPATHDQRSDDDRHRFRLRLTEDDAGVREAMRELVLRKKLPAASPEKDRSDGRPGERSLAPWAQELLGIGLYQAPCYALASTDPGHGWPRQVSHSRSGPIKIMPLPAGADLGSYRVGVSVELDPEVKP